MYNITAYYLMLVAAFWAIGGAWMYRREKRTFWGFYLATWYFIAVAIILGVADG